MYWRDKHISKLTDDELREAIHDVAHIDNHRVTRLSQAGTRHQKLFKNHPPIENNYFTNFTIALNTEFKKRKL